MQGQHVDPEEAVQIHQDLQAKQSVAIHWGTFALANEVQESVAIFQKNLLMCQLQQAYETRNPKELTYTNLNCTHL